MISIYIYVCVCKCVHVYLLFSISLCHTISLCIWFALRHGLMELLLEKTCTNIHQFNVFMLIERILCDFLGPVEFMPHTSTLQYCSWFIFISLRFYNSLSFIWLEFCAVPGTAYIGN